MKSYLFILFLFSPIVAKSAAPNDINSNQRAWFDAVDINGNSDYTDNPSNNASISQWTDKSGSSNHLSQSITTQQPVYKQNTLITQRHGVDFDGVDDVLIDVDDIWTGPVNSSETFIVLTTDQFQQDFTFGSYSGWGVLGYRLSAHIPWSNGFVVFDHGLCCATPDRLSGSVPIVVSQQYFWHFIGLPSMQQVLQDGTLKLSDSGAETYIPDTGSRFTLSLEAKGHNGKYFEFITYQTALNNAQRIILSNYLSAKWNKSFGASPSYADLYNGDSSTNGDYDFFVGGIGEVSGAQTIGTSQGLTITDGNFLSNGKFILAGVNYLVTTPLTGTVTTDLPAGYSNHSNRSWYIDRTGNGGLVNLSFNATNIGIPVNNGDAYGLLHRTGTSGTFTEVDTAIMTGGVLDYSYLPADGIYTIGKKTAPKFSLQKTKVTISDPVNNLVNPKAIPGSNSDYTLIVRNTGGSPDAETTVIKDNIPAELNLFTGDLNGNGSPFVFTDINCPPTTNSITSNLSLDYPSDVVFKTASGAVITPTSSYDSAVRSFEVTMSGTMNASSGADTPCFSIRYRTQLE